MSHDHIPSSISTMPDDRFPMSFPQTSEDKDASIFEDTNSKKDLNPSFSNHLDQFLSCEDSGFLRTSNFFMDNQQYQKQFDNHFIQRAQDNFQLLGNGFDNGNNSFQVMLDQNFHNMFQQSEFFMESFQNQLDSKEITSQQTRSGDDSAKEQPSKQSNPSSKQMNSQSAYNFLQVYFQEKKQSSNNNENIKDDQGLCIKKQRIGLEERKLIYQQKRQEFETKQKTNQDTALSRLQLKKKFRPLTIQQRATFQEKLYSLIDVQYNFLFYGDFCVCKNVFLDADFDDIKSTCCPINYFRPPLRVIQGKNYCLAELDASYNGVQDVEAAAVMLKLLQHQEAKAISDFLLGSYQERIENLKKFKTQVLNHYKNNQQKISEIIAKNHALSLKKAFEIIEQLDKNKIFALHYKKIDPITLAHKQHLVGGNSAFCNLFMGSQNLDMLSQLMSRWGLPHYMDARGIINLSKLIFEGKANFEMNMVTYDGFELHITTTIKRVDLHSFEIIPGVSITDFLEIRILECNPRVLQSIHRRRYLSPQTTIEIFKLDDFHYSEQAEIFVKKFYTKETSTDTEKTQSNEMEC